MLAQKHVHAVEQVGAAHRRFVDDDGPELLVDARVPRPTPTVAHLLRRDVDAEAEEAVYGLAADVERRDSGGREDDGRVRRVVSIVLK